MKQREKKRRGRKWKVEKPKKERVLTAAPTALVGASAKSGGAKSSRATPVVPRKQAVDPAAEKHLSPEERAILEQIRSGVFDRKVKVKGTTAVDLSLLS